MRVVECILERLGAGGIVAGKSREAENLMGKEGRGCRRSRIEDRARQSEEPEEGLYREVYSCPFNRNCTASSISFNNPISQDLRSAACAGARKPMSGRRYEYDSRPPAWPTR
jgi:hypothetical protein